MSLSEFGASSDCEMLPECHEKNAVTVEVKPKTLKIHNNQL